MVSSKEEYTQSFQAGITGTKLSLLQEQTMIYEGS